MFTLLCTSICHISKSCVYRLCVAMRNAVERKRQISQRIASFHWLCPDDNQRDVVRSSQFYGVVVALLVMRVIGDFQSSCVVYTHLVSCRDVKVSPDTTFSVLSWSQSHSSWSWSRSRDILVSVSYFLSCSLKSITCNDF